MISGKGSATSAEPFERMLATLHRPGILALLLGIVTFWLFSPAIHCGFIEYDDGVYVVENLRVLKGLNFEGIRYALHSIEGGSWMPLTWISHMLDVTVFGSQPAGHHFTNILLHSANAGLLLLALNRLTRRLWLSVLVAVVFAWHPLRTESVVWVAERKDVLSTMMWMFGLLAYSRYVEKPCISRYMCVVVCLAIGLMAKPMLVTFPFALLLLDFWPLRRLGRSWPEIRARFGRLLFEKSPLLLVVGLASAATVWSQSKAGAVDHRQASVVQRASRIADNYAFYVQKFFSPTKRTVIYPEKPLTIGVTTVVGLVLFAFSLFTVWRMFEWPWLPTGWFWFVGTLVPVVGLVPVGLSPVADRYSYIPSIGLAIVVVWGVSVLVGNNPWLKRASVVLGLIVVCTSAWATHADIARWKDSETLFESAARTAPHKIAFNNLAYFLVKRGDYPRAIEACTRAIELDPQYGSSYGNRALAYAWSNDYEQAKRDYDQAVKLGARPIQPMRRLRAMEGKATDVSASDDPEEAWHLFAGVFGLEPKSAESLRGRADVRVKVGDTAGGIADYTKAIALLPADASLYTARGNAYALLGDWTNALADMTRAIELSPTNAAGYQNRAVILYKMGQIEKAWDDVNQNLRRGGAPHASFIRALTDAGWQNSSGGK
jgi:Flp pilus assembly protein TadD